VKSTCVDKRVAFLIVCLIIGSPLTVNAQSKRKSEVRSKVVSLIDWDCLTLHYPRARLSKVVRTASKQAGYGVARWGDRTVAYDLNGDGQREYFIPLVCGAVGNCEWGVFALNPSRLLGIVNGENIYIRQRVKQWSALTVYIHDSCCDGHLETHIFRKGKYVKLSGEYHVTSNYGQPGFNPGKSHPYPKFMGTIPSPCASQKINRAAQR
jgi:hypothetical protein